MSEEQPEVLLITAQHPSWNLIAERIPVPGDMVYVLRLDEDSIIFSKPVTCFTEKPSSKKKWWQLW